MSTTLNFIRKIGYIHLIAIVIILQISAIDPRTKQAAKNITAYINATRGGPGPKIISKQSSILLPNTDANYDGQQGRRHNTSTSGDPEHIIDMEMSGGIKDYFKDIGSEKTAKESSNIIDGRNAYIGNQYIPGDIETPTHIVTAGPPALYQLLQQMEHVWSNNRPDALVYTQPTAGQNDVQLPPPNKQLITHSMGGNYTDDYADESDTYDPNNTPSMEMGATHRPSVSGCQHVPTPPQIHGTMQDASNTAAADRQSSPLPRNSTIQKHKRRITFKTISTSTHFVSTPLADLMLKFSISMAKPSGGDARTTTTTTATATNNNAENQRN